ncbi:DUF4019 domain-containing protein [Coralloluteibacterium thermophilus]|uniref:DUF4019 domain-containing protein n=1 Tax=Coralloluteibacterium thermophilum TaxID=2707049 RepID=A0ABV9NJG1_9GAMM
MKAIALSVAVALAGTAGGAWAQQQACRDDATSPPGTLHDAALAMAQAVDRAQAPQLAQLWRQATPVTHAAVTEQQFVESVQNARRPLGQLQRRDWIRVELMDIQAQDGAVAPGRYVSVGFRSRFAGGPAEELVSFRRDDDCQWRFAGYIVAPTG